MRPARRARTVLSRLSLTRQVALLSLLPMIALGLILARVLQSQVVDRTLADATRSARIITRLGVQPTLTPQNLRHGLSPREIRDLDNRLNEPLVGQDLARIKVWNGNHTIVYSEEHSLIGSSPGPATTSRRRWTATPMAPSSSIPRRTRRRRARSASAS